MSNLKIRKIFVTVLMFIIPVFVMLTGCRKSDQLASGYVIPCSSGTVTISASTSVQPLAQALAYDKR